MNKKEKEELLREIEHLKHERDILFKNYINSRQDTAKEFSLNLSEIARQKGYVTESDINSLLELY